MVNTIEQNGGVVKYVEFEGEGHGWRKAETIQQALEDELGYYVEVLKLNPGA
jgi:dipeptidyl aminopeptidase/acylaminoacyl peptidase